MEVVEYFCYHQRPVILSVLDRILLSQISNQFTMKVCWRMLPARSRLIFITSLVGLIQEMGLVKMYSGKCSLHIMVCPAVILGMVITALCYICPT